MKPGLFAGLLGALLFFAGCSGQKEAVGCQADTDCEAGLVCAKETGACRCTTDDACGAGYYCNPYGACQVRPPCLGNQDCDTGFICNSAADTGGSCIPVGTCGSSVHCEFNSYCDPQSNTCVPGCRSTGDCQLGRICVENECVVAGNENDCQKCPTSPAPDATYCDYGEVCDNGNCIAHPDQNNLCDECNVDGTCPGNTMCLIDPEVQNGSYCSPMCEEDRDCPSGYSGCSGVSIVSPDWECDSDNDCEGSRKCVGSAEAEQAYCECTSDDDCGAFMIGLCVDFFLSKACLNDPGLRSCNNDSDCMCLDGLCTGTGLPCQAGSDCEIKCEQSPSGSGGTVGSCVTKTKVCGKMAGLSCDDAQNGEAECRGYLQ